MKKPSFNHRPLGILVNLFGGPGVGKSTLALGIAFELKRLGWAGNRKSSPKKPRCSR